jgi:hypothetical protein
MYVDFEKAKTRKTEQEKKKKSGLFCRDCSGYCFDSHTNDYWIQRMKIKVWFYETCVNERVVNTGLPALCDVECSLST